MSNLAYTVNQQNGRRTTFLQKIWSGGVLDGYSKEDEKAEALIQELPALRDRVTHLRKRTMKIFMMYLICKEFSLIAFLWNSTKPCFPVLVDMPFVAFLIPMFSDFCFYRNRELFSQYLYWKSLTIPIKDNEEERQKAVKKQKVVDFLTNRVDYLMLDHQLFGINLHYLMLVLFGVFLLLSVMMINTLVIVNKLKKTESSL